MSLKVTAKLELTNATLVDWRSWSLNILIQMWVCFNGHCYCWYACVFNTLKQCNFTTPTCPFFFFFFSSWIFTCAAPTVIVLINWKNMRKTCSQQIVNYNQTLNYLLEIILFSAVGILKLFLNLLKPLFKACLHIKPQSKFSLMQYFRV